LSHLSLSLQAPNPLHWNGWARRGKSFCTCAQIPSHHGGHRPAACGHLGANREHWVSWRQAQELSRVCLLSSCFLVQSYQGRWLSGSHTPAFLYFLESWVLSHLAALLNYLCVYHGASGLPDCLALHRKWKREPGTGRSHL
jgi:hypothetical protein